jgi:hypothetical protein
MPAITYCPPAAAHFTAPPEPVFGHRPYTRTPVNGHATAEGFDGGGISFDDYSRMHTSLHTQAGHRRLDTPAWALRNDLLANVIAQYCLNRASYRCVPKPPIGAAEKLALAKMLSKRRKKMLTEQLDRLCHRYVAIKNQMPPDYAALRNLEIEIENTDTSIRIVDNAAEIAAGVVYHFYHRNVDSVAVGQALGLKPPHCRILLYRLRKVARELGYKN